MNLDQFDAALPLLNLMPHRGQWQTVYNVEATPQQSKGNICPRCWFPSDAPRCPVCAAGGFDGAGRPRTRAAA